MTEHIDNVHSKCLCLWDMHGMMVWCRAYQWMLYKTSYLRHPLRPGSQYTIFMVWTIISLHVERFLACLAYRPYTFATAERDGNFLNCYDATWQHCVCHGEFSRNGKYMGHINVLLITFGSGILTQSASP